MFDYHIHSQFSPDSSLSMKDAIEQSISIGTKEICFTDHLDFDFDGKGHDIVFNYDYYLSVLNSHIEQYKDRITIKKGIEVGLQPHIIKECKEYVTNKDLDFIIGSIHSVNKEDLYSGNLFDSITQKEAYLKYFEELLYVIDNYDNYSVFGHLDMIKRYGGYEIILPLEDYKEITITILKKLIEKGKGIELNTSGIRYKLGDYHPSIDIVKLYLEMGGEIITIGSDAHSKKHVGFELKNAAKHLKDMGFKYITTFDKMVPKFNPIDSLF